jgi:putative protease
MAEEKEKLVGEVALYFSNLEVAAIDLSDKLKIGDEIHIKGHTTDFTQTVDSIQIDNEKIDSAKKGDSIGLKVSEPVRENDQVFLV